MCCLVQCPGCPCCDEHVIRMLSSVFCLLLSATWPAHTGQTGGHWTYVFCRLRVAVSCFAIPIWTSESESCSDITLSGFRLFWSTACAKSNHHSKVQLRSLNVLADFFMESPCTSSSFNTDSDDKASEQATLLQVWQMLHVMLLCECRVLSTVL